MKLTQLTVSALLYAGLALALPLTGAPADANEDALEKRQFSGGPYAYYQKYDQVAEEAAAKAAELEKRQFSGGPYAYYQKYDQVAEEAAAKAAERDLEKRQFFGGPYAYYQKYAKEYEGEAKGAEAA